MSLFLEHKHTPLKCLKLVTYRLIPGKRTLRPLPFLHCWESIWPIGVARWRFTFASEVWNPVRQISSQTHCQSSNNGYVLDWWVSICNRNLGISRAPLHSQAHQGTGLFTSAAMNQRGCPKGSSW